MNKTDEILQVLRDELREGRYPKGGRFPSEYALMHRFGVSRPTINKVTSMLEKEGYIARGVRGAGTTVLASSTFPVGHIAYIGPIAHLYSARIIDGIQKTALFNNYAVSFFCPGNDLLEYLDKISNSKFDGVLATTIGKLPDTFPLPTVHLDDASPISGPVRASVCCANYHGAEKMAELAVSRGHREIVICTETSYNSFGSRTDRVRGFTDVLQKHGIKNIEARLFYTNPLVNAAGVRTIKSIINKFPGTTLILCDTDDIAVTLYHTKQNIMPDKNIAITGFGNIQYRCAYLPFASVEQHPEEIGTQGVIELIRCIENKNYNSEKIIEIETELKNIESIPYIK